MTVITCRDEQWNVPEPAKTEAPGEREREKESRRGLLDRSTIEEHPCNRGMLLRLSQRTRRRRHRRRCRRHRCQQNVAVDTASVARFNFNAPYTLSSRRASEFRREMRRPVSLRDPREKRQWIVANSPPSVDPGFDPQDTHYGRSHGAPAINFYSWIQLP